MQNKQLSFSKVSSVIVQIAIKWQFYKLGLPIHYYLCYSKNNIVGMYGG